MRERRIAFHEYLRRGRSITRNAQHPCIPATADAPRLVAAGDATLADVLCLIQGAFAGMDGRIDPPSSVHRLTIADLAAPTVEVWAIGMPPVACVVLIPQADALYIGKLAVTDAARGRGLARALIEHAANRAQTLGLRTLTLQARIALTENHAAFARMGFQEVGRTAHPGHARPTSITFARGVAP